MVICKWKFLYIITHIVKTWDPNVKVGITEYVYQNVASYVDFNNCVATSDEYVYCIYYIHLIPLSLKYFTFPIIQKRKDLNVQIYDFTQCSM
jgi:hypothetical protein